MKNSMSGMKWMPLGKTASDNAAPQPPRPHYPMLSITHEMPSSKPDAGHPIPMGMSHVMMKVNKIGHSVSPDGSSVTHDMEVHEMAPVAMDSAPKSAPASPQSVPSMGSSMSGVESAVNDRLQAKRAARMNK